MATKRDQALASYISVEITRAEAGIVVLKNRVELLCQLREVLRICPACSGVGRIVREGYDDGESGIACMACEGSGHNRVER